MKDDEMYVCRRRKLGNVYEVACKKGKKEVQHKKMYCVFSSGGKSAGASGLGFGAQYGTQTPVIKCFPDDEFKRAVAKELKAKEKNIKIIDV